MVIRDLTLRSAASFGSFHLIRLLYDEYMFFLIEHKVAKATGKTTIAVMSEVGVNLSLHTPQINYTTRDIIDFILGRGGVCSYYKASYINT